MKALISTIEPRESGYRVAQVVGDDAVFGVAEGMFWVDCGDVPAIADQYWYDPQDQTFKQLPAPWEDPAPQPEVGGAETL